MKTPLQKQLARAAPSILIETLYSEDPYSPWDFEDASICQGDHECLNATVRALVVVGGNSVTGSDALGGVWSEIGGTRDPEIGGYERQMTGAALENLLLALESKEDPFHHNQIQALVFEVKAALKSL